MTGRKRNVFDIKLDPEEQEIEDALPNTWEKLPFLANQEEELAHAKKAAANYFRKAARINKYSSKSYQVFCTNIS